MNCTVKEYIQSKSTLLGKINAIGSLIDSMELNALSTIEDSGFASYSMDDGQMKVTTEFRSMDQISKGILALEQIQQRYINRYNGRVTVFRNKLNY